MRKRANADEVFHPTTPSATGIVIDWMNVNSKDCRGKHAGEIYRLETDEDFHQI